MNAECRMQNAELLHVKIMLTDPFLQLPTHDSVRVVWFTDFPGIEHQVIYGENFSESVAAVTTKLTWMREDEKSKIEPPLAEVQYRDIWRHEAIVTELIPGQKISYQVSSKIPEAGETITSEIFRLTAKPKPGVPLKILLTSDHQLMPMSAANLQKVEETIGQVDAIFCAGDLVNVPDRASEWFDDLRGGSFFSCLQGKANYQLTKNGLTTSYHGGKLIQFAPLFTAIGNHEFMGKFANEQSLNQQFDNTLPRQVAEELYRPLAGKINPFKDSRTKDVWIKANSFNTDTYEEIFSLPESSTGGKKYYAITFGDIRLVVLLITNMWRSPKVSPEVRGRYQERVRDFESPENWGYGQHIYEPISKGSVQYQWLENELNSPEFQQAKYKIVMFHHPVHTLGANIVPPYTDPQGKIERDRPRRAFSARQGEISSIIYEYPPENDYLMRDLMPLLETAGVHLVFYGHSHLWNRFLSPSGINFLESSNVGNSYGAYLGENKRPIPPDNYDIKYAAVGDPYGLEAIIPSIAPLHSENQNYLPYIASNDLTVFSILDTEKGKVASYYFDTRKPESPVVKFDEFLVINEA